MVEEHLNLFMGPLLLRHGRLGESLEHDISGNDIWARMGEGWLSLGVLHNSHVDVVGDDTGSPSILAMTKLMLEHLMLLLNLSVGIFMLPLLLPHLIIL
jgi:hypothetical protein